MLIGLLDYVMQLETRNLERLDNLNAIENKYDVDYIKGET